MTRDEADELTGLLLLAPELQERILGLPPTVSGRAGNDNWPRGPVPTQTVANPDTESQKCPR